MDTGKHDELFSHLLEMFGDGHSHVIAKAIAKAAAQSADDRGQQPTIEATVEIMFELINDGNDGIEVIGSEAMDVQQEKQQQQVVEHDEEEGAFGGSTSDESSTYTGTIPKKTFADLASTVTEFRLQSTTAKAKPPPAQEYWPENYHKVLKLIDEGYKVLVLLRGLPGSGKSYLAQSIIKHCKFDPRLHIFSADDFFYDVNGDYVYNVNRLSEAHEFTHNRTLKKMREGWSPVIIDNTNMKQWEMYPYVKFAIKYHYVIEILEPVTPWARSPWQLAERNRHKVPRDKISLMLEKYERTNVRRLLANLDAESHIGLQAALRHFPPFSQEFIATHKHLFPELQTDEAMQTNNRDDESIVQDLLHIGTPPPKPRRNCFENKPTSSWEPPPSQPTSSINWQAYEEDKFWTRYDKQADASEVAKNKKAQPTTTLNTAPPKPKREVNLLKSLQEATRDSSVAAATQDKDKKQDEENEEPDNAGQTVVLLQHKKNCNNENLTFKEIRQMFPSVGVKFLWDLFVKCKGDGDWTIDILVNDEATMSNLMEGADDLDCKCDGTTDSPRPKRPAKVPEPKVNNGKKKQQQQHQTLQQPFEPTPETREARENAKRLIEEQFVISDEHYSEHTRRIRDLRRGCKPPSSSPIQPSASDEDMLSEDASTDSQPDNEIVEITLGTDLVQQLETMFGTNVFDITDGNLVIGGVPMKTNVFMNKSLASQLYALWCESLYNQLEEQRQMAMREDLELARKLDAEQKYPALFRTEPPKNLQDVIDIEMALAAYKEDVEQWKNEKAPTMATQLARDKLYAIFPNTDRSLLDELLNAHHNDVNETIAIMKETLQGNADEVIQQRSRELFAAAQQEIDKLAVGNVDFNYDDTKLGSEETKRAALKDFEECRNQAQYHSQLKAECYAKARNAISRGEHGVALYYSQIADLHRTKIEHFNHKAANCLMEAHNVSQSSENMLDLHYLHSSEAIQCLDLFLDKHIAKLQAAQRPHREVFVITGRGKNSMNGIPAIKIRVKARLRERGLKYSEVNPGLLKVKIFHSSTFA